MDGGFHYQESKYANRPLKKQKEIDLIKDILAAEHDIEVIHIDCQKSDGNYIKNNILNSKLNEIFDLSSVDWKLCDVKAQKNLIIEVCDLYNTGIHDLLHIKDILHIGISSVQKYIKLGADVGLCDYTIERSIQEGIEKLMVKVNVVDGNGNIIHNFLGIKRCAEAMTNLYGINFNSPNIIKSCKTNKPYKGFNFRYDKIDG